MESEIAALCTALFQDLKHLVGTLEHRKQQIISGLNIKLLKKGRQAKKRIYNDFEKTVDLYAVFCQSCLNALSMAVDNVTTPTDAALLLPTFLLHLRLKPKQAAVGTVTLENVFITMLNLRQLALVLSPITFIDTSLLAEEC